MLVAGQRSVQVTEFPTAFPFDQQDVRPVVDDLQREVASVVVAACFLGKFFRADAVSLTPFLLRSQVKLDLLARVFGGDGLANWLPDPSNRVGGQLDPAPYLAYQVRAVRAPSGGHFSVWSSTDNGPDLYVSTSLNGYNYNATDNNPLNDNVIYSFVGSHTHFNWGFTKAGEYQIDIIPLTYYGSDASPIALTQDLLQPFTFTFDVVPVPEPTACLAIGGLVLACGATIRSRICGFNMCVLRRRQSRNPVTTQVS